MRGLLVDRDGVVHAIVIDEPLKGDWSVVCGHFIVYSDNRARRLLRGHPTCVRCVARA